MTIKEIEELAGMPRANIRYYEAEGLLNPTRSENGYRDYSTEDFEILQKIKLLRSLHMSMEEIKALHTGERELSVVLEQQIRKLAANRAELDNAQSVCETMYKDGTKYEGLVNQCFKIIALQRFQFAVFFCLLHSFKCEVVRVVVYNLHQHAFNVIVQASVFSSCSFTQLCKQVRTQAESGLFSFDCQVHILLFFEFQGIHFL